MKRLDELFNVWYGVNLEVVNCEVIADGGIPFVSRQSVNNGVVTYVKLIESVKPNPKNTLSIAVSGSVLSTFFHDYEYYSGRDVYVAEPKIPMSKEVMLYYCYVIEQNKYRYNYGRGANKTFRSILIPDTTELPSFVTNENLVSPFSEAPVKETHLPELNTSSWKWFRYDEVFDIKKGFYNKKPETHSGRSIPFIGATDGNNGITDRYDIQDIEDASKTGDAPNQPLSSKIFPGNCITVSNNGSIGYAFYQPIDFTCTHDVNPLYLKGHELTKYIAVFLCTLIEMDRYRWAYGRKWRPKRMPSSLIKLPIDSKGNPDWDFMENYIKGLPFSSNL